MVFEKIIIIIIIKNKNYGYSEKHDGLDKQVWLSKKFKYTISSNELEEEI